MYTFLRWLLIFVLITLAGAGAILAGLHTSLWEADSTKISFLIISLLAIFTIWCGYLSYRLNKDSHELIDKRAQIGWFASDMVFTLGMIGTVIGFIMMLSGFHKVDITQIQTVQQLLGTLGQGMGVALYTTLSGLIAGLILKVQYFNLQYGILSNSRNEVSS